MEGQGPRSYSVMMHQTPSFSQHHGLIRPRLQTYYGSAAEPPSHQQQPLEAAKLNPTAFAETRGTSLANDPQDSNNALALESDKLAIYKHPLFPLLAQLLEKCEHTTTSAEEVASANFDNEIKAFVIQQAKEGKGYLINDAEVDSLMIKALQVLRIHLLELEKVNELCKDFCSRYIACLRGKLNSENLMRSLNVQPGSPCDDDMHTSSDSGDVQPPEQEPITQRDCSPTLLYPQQLQTMPAFQYLNAAKADGFQAGGSYHSLQSELSSVSAPSTAVRPSTIARADAETSTNVDLPSECLDEIGQSSPTATDKKSLKRGVLPKQATSIMKAWLFQHLVHPYPSEEEKKQIADQCNLKILQVNNWFINARRRILQPMLDSSPYSNRNRKIKPQKCPAQRAWPDAIGVMSPYGAESPQFHTGGPLSNYTIVNQGIEQSGAPTAGVSMIINVPANSAGQVPGAAAAPVQYIQVAGLPSMVHGVAGSMLQMGPTLHQCIVTPVEGQSNIAKGIPAGQLVSMPVPLSDGSAIAPVSSAVSSSNL